MSTIERTRPVPGGADHPDVERTVLIADSCSQGIIDAIEARGCRAVVDEQLTPKTLPQAMAEHDPDVLIVRSTKVPAPVLEAAPRLSLIVRAGAGYDNIDVATASARGIYVANCPGRNAIAVAELTWALILACDRRVPDQVLDLRNGVWDKKLYAKARGLHGRTLGIIGLGRIGEAVAERGRAFGMNVIAWSRRLSEARAAELNLGYRATPLDVAREADVISLHVASRPETRHLVDRAFCTAMRDGAFLVNTTRGEVLDEEAVIEAIRLKGIRVGLDVYAGEPGAGEKSFEPPIVNEAGVYGTHHVGASTDQAQEAIAAETVHILSSFLSSGTVPNCINRAAAGSAHCLLTVRHLNRPGVLAHVFRVLGAAQINVEEMENIIYEGATAACARIQLGSAPTGPLLESIRENEHIMSADLSAVPGEGENDQPG